MISDLEYLNGKLTWTTTTGEKIEKEYAGATYISDSNTVVVLYDESSIAVALNEKGEEICRISNSEDTYLMYLVNHKNFNLCVAASHKEGDAWRDMYLRFDGKAFVKASDAR